MSKSISPKVQGGEVTYELHPFGWKAFQNLCATVMGRIWGKRFKPAKAIFRFTTAMINRMNRILSSRPQPRNSSASLNAPPKFQMKLFQSKVDAAAVWCEHATIHAKTYNGKPWTYLLIPHDQIAEQMGLSGLAASCTHKSPGQGTGSQGKE
ncbi:MAG: hypothetical protein O7D34_06235 [Ignavibacteria bacterium]|nr:hypothetical protein [Ignavibacteria bacterium]